jgi:sec-independent protein translocase protein TatC
MASSDNRSAVLGYLADFRDRLVRSLRSSGEYSSTILGHLTELRDRLTRSVIAVVITTGLSFIFARHIFDLLTFKSALTLPIFDALASRFGLITAPDVNLIYIEMIEMFGTYMRVSLASGFALAMPFLTYQLVMFVTPALTTREKRYVYLILPWVALMFAVGVTFAYFVLLPPSIGFLLTFGSDIARPEIKIGSYISLVTRLLLAVGLVFELPVLTTFLARVGLVSPKWLGAKRRLAFVIAFVLGGLITPTFDPINQSLVAIPLCILYELSIWLAKLVYRQKPPIPPENPDTGAGTVSSPPPESPDTGTGTVSSPPPESPNSDAGTVSSPGTEGGG